MGEVCEGVGDGGLCVVVAVVEKGLNELGDVDVWCGGHWWIFRVGSELPTCQQWQWRQ